MDLSGLLQRWRGGSTQPAVKMRNPTRSVGGKNANQALWLRVISLGLGTVLALYASSRILAEIARPAFRTADFFANGARPPIEDNGGLAAFVSFDGDVLSDRATSKARLVLEAPSFDPATRLDINHEAQEATRSALAVSPVNSAMWLLLGLLKANANEPSTGPLKMSFLTGPLSTDAIAARIRAVATTAAASDEEIQVLGQLDIRALMTKYPSYQTALSTSYRQATADGKKFLLDATAAVDPKFSGFLRQSR